MIKFDRTIWEKEYISNKSRAAWRCSKCWSGFLQISRTNIKTKRSHNYAVLTCTDDKCKRVYFITGRTKHFAEGSNVGAQYFRIDDFRLYPTHFQPELHFFKIPENLNALIKDKLQLSFNHFWHDFDACANKIRQSLELIVKEKGAIGEILHQQIKSLNTELGDDLINSLLALKWIGNEGSHPGNSFTKDQILDTYEILVDVLNQFYPENTENEKKKKFVKSAIDNKGIKDT